MQKVSGEFEALHMQVLAIDLRTIGSLGRIASVKAKVDKSFETDLIPLRERRILIEELRMIQRQAVVTVKSRTSKVALRD